VQYYVVYIAVPNPCIRTIEVALYFVVF